MGRPEVAAPLPRRPLPLLLALALLAVSLAAGCPVGGGAAGRAYPQRVAGTPTWIDFDPASRILALSFVTSSAGGGETEIYVPETRLYPGGFDLHVGAPAGSWTSAWDPDRGVLTLTTDGARGVGLCIAPSGVACP